MESFDAEPVAGRISCVNNIYCHSRNFLTGIYVMDLRYMHSGMIKGEKIF